MYKSNRSYRYQSKRKYAKKAYKPRGTYSKYEPTWGQVAQKALSGVKYLTGLINAEVKNIDDSQINIQSDYNGVIVNTINAPAQGDAYNQRSGDSIKCKTLTIRGEIKQQGTVQEETRIIIFLDKENKISTVAQLLSTVGSVNGVFSDKNNDYRYVTRVLFDQTLMVTTNDPIVTFKQVIPLEWHTHFAAGTTTVINNALKVAFITQQSVSANSSYLNYLSRLSYMDN